MKKEVSSIWYLVPLFFGLLGGIVAYVAIKDDDPDKASNCLALGIGITILGTLIMFAYVRALLSSTPY